MNDFLRGLGFTIVGSKPTKKPKRTQLSIYVFSDAGEVVHVEKCNPTDRDKTVSMIWNKYTDVNILNLIMLNGRTKVLRRSEIKK